MNGRAVCDICEEELISTCQDTFAMCRHARSGHSSAEVYVCRGCVKEMILKDIEENGQAGTTDISDTNLSGVVMEAYSEVAPA